MEQFQNAPIFIHLGTFKAGSFNTIDEYARLMVGKRELELYWNLARTQKYTPDGLLLFPKKALPFQK